MLADTLATDRFSAPLAPALDGGASHAPQEEFANAASHAAGVVLACAALPTLATGVSVAEPLRLAGMLVFALSMMAVYLASSLFHAMPAGRAKAWLRRVDHAAIFVFIAGSATPFAIGRDAAHADAWVLGVIWIAAAAGATSKLLGGLRNRRLSTITYLAFGWLVAALAQPALQSMSPATFNLVACGGACYSVGCVFFMLDRRLRFAHLVWHVLVLAGSACHFLAVLQFAA